MDEKNVSKDQAAALCRSVHPGLRYLARLRSRMEQAGFLPDDPLFRLVNQAYDAVHKPSVHAHYLFVQVGRRSGRGKWSTPSGLSAEPSKCFAIWAGLGEFLLLRRRLPQWLCVLCCRAARRLFADQPPQVV
jgi:hypothetical protein